ncbi:MAG TPA: 2-amino-4-hydroxy-6-hydroxymethyldihydropteridine diphosphokinase, partial [Polyangiaceae bacterium LLY-WYZ-15_(1-7)]|nr:2-amino-4-hydroxy-6-hydroxymethyldihydropteridine diphosphokinase [Polyangiaceae bacterium LLY-WYZ-15_(1-7)]
PGRDDRRSSHPPAHRPGRDDLRSSHPPAHRPGRDDRRSSHPPARGRGDGPSSADPHLFVVGVGANLGARWATLEAAAAHLDALGARVEVRSPVYATPALVLPGAPPGPPYLNAAWRVRFAGDPTALLARLHQVEATFGRERRVRWGARTLDLDLLSWGGGEVATPALRVPHPRLAERPFALQPLLDVAPALRRLYRAPRPPRRAPRPRVSRTADALTVEAPPPDALALALGRAFATDAPASVARAVDAPDPATLLARLRALSLAPRALTLLPAGDAGSLRALVVGAPLRAPAPRVPADARLEGGPGEGRASVKFPTSL